MADDLLSLINSTSERVQRESMDFQTDMARGLMDASGGEITGVEVTRTDDDVRGVHQTETVFDRAARNLNLVTDVNPEQEAAAIRTSRERGIPLPLARALDNREMKKPDLRSLAPETLAFFGDDLSSAAVAKDDVEGIDNIVAAAQCAAMSPEDRRDGLLDGIKRNGYSASQLADLKAAGYSPLPDDPTGSSGVFSIDSMKSLNATTKWPVLESWYSGPGEVEQSKLEKEAAERFEQVFRHGFDNVRGSGWLVNATPETAASYIQTLDEEIVTMQGLYALYGDGWKEFNDDDLTSAISEVGKTFDFDSSRVSPARLRPAGVGWETDWAQVFNVFGIIDAYEHRTKLSQRELDEVHRDPLSFSHGDRAELVDYLEKQARSLRGMTRWNQDMDVLLRMPAFMVEYSVSGGALSALGVLPKVIAPLRSLKGLSARVGSFLAFEGLRTLTKDAAMRDLMEAWHEVNPRVSQTIADGEVVPGMTERDLSRFASTYFNRVLNSYIENVSEGLGGRIPGAGKLLRPLAWLVPQRVKNAVFVQAVRQAASDVSVSKGAMIARKIAESSGFHGFAGEYMEEKAGDAIRAVSTELAQSIGTPYGDLGQDSVFGSLEDELHLMGTLAVTGAVLQSVRIPTAVGDIRRAVRFVDAHRAVHTAVEEAKTTQRSPETLEYLLQYYTRGANTAYLSPEGARTLFQSAPDLMGRIGVSEDMIGEAELKERMIPVSMAKVHAHVSRAELDTLLVKLVPDPKHTLTMEDAAKVNLEEEAQKVAEETDRVRAETKAAYDEAIQKMMALNRPASEIRAVARLLSMANYFAAESNMSAADFIRGLDFQSMKFQEWLAQQSAEDIVPEEYTAFQSSLSDDLVSRLDNEEYVTAYRAAQIGPDGKLYSPMAGKINGEWGPPIELGKWEQAVERPELIRMRNGKPVFKLDKGNGSSIEAAYNPYIHSSLSPLNDQFSSAYKRPELVVLEVRIPKSELTSGYKAQYAKDAVGMMNWHSGVVSGKLPEGKKRKVILSRWDKPVRIVPDKEVAQKIADLLKGENITIPANVVTPALRKELEALGVPIVDNVGISSPMFQAVGGSVGQEVDVKSAAFTKWFGKSKVVDQQGNPLVVYHGSRIYTGDKGHFTVFRVDPEYGAMFSSDMDTAAWFAETGRPARFKDIEIDEDALRNASLDEMLAFYQENIDPSAEFQKVQYDDGSAMLRLSTYGGRVSTPLGRDERSQRDKLFNEIAYSVRRENADRLERRGLYSVYLRAENPLVVRAKGAPFYAIPFRGKTMRADDIARIAKKEGYDSCIIRDNVEGTEDLSRSDTYIVFSPEQIKSATDNNGTFSLSNPDIRFQAVGDKFRTIRDALPEEEGETPLFKRKFSSVRQVLPDLAEIFNRFPDGVTAADGKKVLIKNPEGGSVAKRLMHLIAGVDENSGDRNSFEFSNKIAWLPRIVETVENAQVKLRDPQTGNYAYVRSYSEGVIHSVVVTKNGVVADTETFDHGLITQFAAKYAGRRGEFTVVWERTDGDSSSAPTSANGSQGNDPSALTSKEEGGKRSPQSPSTGESSGDAPYSPSAGTNVAPSLKNVKLLQGDVIYRGATTFTDNWNAMVTLFEGEADASTLVHEIGHYATEMMRHLVESGAASERMQKDYATLMEWATRGTNDPAEQRERLARAFEAYCMEGKAPSIELEGAFATLRRLLLHVYNSVKALGVEISNDVRKVFDGMLATDATIRQESFLREAAMEIDKELLGLSQPEIRTFRELIAKSNDQAVQKLTAEKNAQLAKLRPQWRKEANELMDGEPVYNAWRAIEKEGGIDYVALEEICGEYMAGELRKKGLTTNPGRKSKAKIDKKTGEVIRPAGYYSAKSGKHPASFAFESGFSTVEEMVDALFYAQSPQSFVESYMADAEKRFNEAFNASEAALSVEASVEALEKLGELLAVKGGKQGYRIRRALLRQQAREEINAMTVGNVVSDKKLIADCRTNARKLTQAANKGDFITAFEEAKALRYNLEVLRLKGDAKQEVERVEKLLSRGRHARKGTIYGDHQEALTDLSVRFGFTRTQPKRPLRHTVASVVKEYNEEAEANGEPRLELPAFLLSESGPYRGLSFAEFQQLGMLADFLYGEGKALVSARETAFREQVNAALEGSVAELEAQPHKYTKSDNLFLHGYRSMLQQGTKLRNIIGMAANWNADSSLQKLYDEMVFAASEQTQLMTDPARTATAALDALYRSTRELPLDTIRDIPFPADVIAEGYRKWDAEKVVAACLNMGNAKNRQRLIDGYEWGENGETYCNRIAALLTAEDWANVQKIWDAINGNLAQRVAQTYREEYHHDLVEEPALPFQVTTADGQTIDVAGGYYPLDYLYHKNTIVRNREESQSNYNPPAFRRASFTFERTEKLSDPLRLSLNLVYEHLFDAAHYVSHRAVMRKVLRVVNDTTFRKHFEQTQGFERYQALKALVENVAAPGAALKGEVSQFEEWGRSALTALSLWASPSVAFMQVAGATFGLDELGSYYFSALRDIAENPMEAYRFVMSHSGMMRDRVNLKDLDLKTRTNRFQENVVERTRREITEIGYAPMRYIDLGVATPIWMAAYHQAVDRGMDMPHAVAAADEFVAKTQGATRPIDMSPIQLKAWGRGFAVFFSAVSAGATMGTKTLSRIKTGAATPTAAVAAVAANILAPYFLSSLARAIITGPGGDDDDAMDRMMRAFFKELVTQPFGGIPFVRDVADTVAMAAFNKHGYSTRVFFENSSLRGPNEVAVAAYEGIAAAFDENPDRAIYKLADAVGTLFRVPVVGAYERIRRILTGWIDDPDFMPDFDKETRKRRR